MMQKWLVRQVGRHVPIKAPDWSEESWTGHIGDGAPGWLDVALHPAGPRGQLLLTLADPMKSLNSGEPFGRA